MTLWICGEYKSGDIPNAVWDFVGIFSDKLKAQDACKNQNYFIAPIELDSVGPEVSIVFPNIEYPFKY